MKPAILVLVIACLSLTAGLVVVRQKAEARAQTAEAHRARATAELDEVKTKFSDLEKLYAVQEGALKMRHEELTSVSNMLAKVDGELAKTTDDLKAIQAEMTKREQRIAALESERDGLTKKMDDLTSSIDTLELQIADTKQKLATAEGDKTFLLAELKRMQTEKDTLVRQFNDLAALRTQVARLKEEAAIKQRLAWKRIGVYAMQEQKGAERLFAKSFALAPADSRLNAELYQGNRQLFRAPASTNAPPGRATSGAGASGGASSVEPPPKTR